MRGLGLFFGTRKRNVPIVLDDPRPLPRYTNELESKDAGCAGFTVLSRADPNYAGDPPRVPGSSHRAPLGPDQSFEE